MATFDIQKYDFYHQLVSLPFVEKILLFGSRARSDYRSRSDIDLAIFCPAASDAKWLDILAIIEKADTLLKIDCLRLDQLSLQSLLRKNIEKEGIILYVKTHP